MRALVVALFVGASLCAQERFPLMSYRSLFDGTTLDGWVTSGGRYDGKAEWTVANGEIVGREGPDKAGGLLYTAGTYTNFVFACDVRIEEPFDSGVFLRMVPRAANLKGAQVTLDARPDGEIGAIYADGYLQHAAKCAESALRHGAWNRFEVACIGADYHVVVWLNGAQITDYRMAAEDAAFARSGRIGLQVHGARGEGEREVRFRNVGIRELPDFDPALFTCDALGVLAPTAPATALGWGPAIPAGSRVSITANRHAFENALTPKITGAVDLRFDYRIAPGKDVALLLLGVESGLSIMLGGSEGAIGTPLRVPYVPVKARAEGQRPLGAWNTLELQRRADTVSIAVNGLPTCTVDLSPTLQPGVSISVIAVSEPVSAVAAEITNCWLRTQP